jgi:ubiquinone/menaquinone biosynthesis methyltransferase
MSEANTPVPAAPIAEVSRRPGSEAAHGGAVRAMFDRIAPTYDLLNRTLSAGLDVRWRNRAVALLSDAPPGGPVLDVCAGTLDLTAAVERAFPDREVVAVDFSEEMLDRGRHKVRRAEIVVGDALALPLADGRFAAAICGFGFRNLSDPARGVAELGRVLAPGGRLVILEFFRPPSSGEGGVRGAATRAFHAAFARVVLPAAGAIVSRDGAAYAYLARSMATFLSRAEAEALLSRNGFVDVQGEDLALGVASIVTGRKAFP